MQQNSILLWISKDQLVIYSSDQFGSVGLRRESIAAAVGSVACGFPRRRIPSQRRPFQWEAASRVPDGAKRLHPHRLAAAHHGKGEGQVGHDVPAAEAAGRRAGGQQAGTRRQSGTEMLAAMHRSINHRMLRRARLELPTSWGNAPARQPACRSASQPDRTPRPRRDCLLCSTHIASAFCIRTALSARSTASGRPCSPQRAPPGRARPGGGRASDAVCCHGHDRRGRGRQHPRPSSARAGGGQANHAARA